MKTEPMYIKDENTPVIVFMYLRHGGYMTVRSTAKLARESLRQWKKFWLFVQKPLEEQKLAPKEEMPWSLYHFLEGDIEKPETLNASCSVIFSEVVGMTYSEIVEDDHKKFQQDFLKQYSDMIGVIKKIIRAEMKGEEWKGEDQP